MHAVSKTTYTKFTQRDMDEAGLAENRVGSNRWEILGIGYGNSGTFIKKLNSFRVTKSLIKGDPGEPAGEGTRDEKLYRKLPI